MSVLTALSALAIAASAAWLMREQRAAGQTVRVRQRIGRTDYSNAKNEALTKKN